jgi:hypothetical protein
VRSHGKRRVRLNCISHILSQILIKRVTRPLLAARVSGHRLAVGGASFGAEVCPIRRLDRYRGCNTDRERTSGQHEKRVSWRFADRASARTRRRSPCPRGPDRSSSPELRLTWRHMSETVERHLPQPRVPHPWLEQRLVDPLSNCEKLDSTYGVHKLHPIELVNFTARVLSPWWKRALMIV